ncbi:MAG: hypothetical protein ACRD2C_15080, partial [Acidimicrobiales bacterium]
MVFDFKFTVDLHTEEGRKIAAAAHCRLRPGEIDNQWKDTVGRGAVGAFHLLISRGDAPHEWTVGAIPTDDDYDRAAAATLREDVLAA